MWERESTGEVPDSMAVLPCLCHIQNACQSARIPRIEEIQPKITVPISLTPHCDSCWKLSEAIVDVGALEMENGSGGLVSLGSILLVIYIVFLLQ